MSISVDDVEALRSILSSLPRHQPKQVSKQEAIASLVIELAAAQRRGYSADDLARLMSEKGIDINGPTLRNCLRRLRKKRRARDKAKTPQASGGTIAGSSGATSTDKKTARGASGEASTPPPPSPARELGTAKIESRAAPSSSDERTPQK
jgi:hypothetical protein